MLPIILITIRESVEIFLLISLLLKVAPDKHFKKIIIYISSITILFVFGVYLYIFGLRSIQYELHEIIERYEHYAQVVIGLFLLFTGFLFHRIISHKKDSHISKAILSLENRVIDTSLILTIVLLILLEGLEIILLTFPLTTSFIQGLIGVGTGFGIGFLFVVLFQFLFRKIPFKHVIVGVEIGIVLIAIHFLYIGFAGILK